MVIFQLYEEELESGTANPYRFDFDGGVHFLQKFDPHNLRMTAGDAVECRVGPGPNDYINGFIIETMYRESEWAASKVAAYKIKMDDVSALRVGVPPSRAVIWAPWDDDYYIRPLPPKQALKLHKRNL